MILHIAIDDKFIDMGLREFEKAFPGMNELIIVADSLQLRHVKSPCKLMKTREFLDQEFINSLSNYSMVILHWMDELKLQLINRSTAKTKFHWIGWGGDYCSLLSSEETLLLPLTNEAFKVHRKWKRFNLRESIFRKIFFKKIDLFRTLLKVESVSTVIPQDYESLFQRNNLNIPYRPWTYATMEDDLILPDFHGKLDSRTVLFGNSATWSNNHLDILPDLESFSNLHIICPLSYGEDECKLSLIPRLQKSTLEIRILTDFFPPQEYLKIISSCGVVVMNHLRQQAMGNILSMLYQGSKIYLNESNPAYRYFLENGITIFKTSELNTESFESLLPDEIVMRNRRKLIEIWGRKTQNLKTIKLLETRI